VIAQEALYGWIGDWVKSVAPLTEADPTALLALGLGALGHCVRKTVNVQGLPLNPSTLLVGDERAGGGIAWGLVDPLFSSISSNWSDGLFHRHLPPAKTWPAWVGKSDQGRQAKNLPNRLLRKPRKAGAMIDILTELAERHVLRLAGLNAVVDESGEIMVDHLLAALAVWDHSEETLWRRLVFCCPSGSQ
jgi:hypothetical protein